MSNMVATNSLGQLLIKYNQLPFITIKNSSHYYLIPHKPRRPKMISFNMAANAIKQHSLKYNQYFSSDKLWDKVSKQFEENKIKSSVKQKWEKQLLFKQNLQNYTQLINEYKYKYKEPIRLMNINSFKIFKIQYFKQQKQSQKRLTQKENNNSALEQGLNKEQNSKEKHHISSGKEQQSKKSKQQNAFKALNKINSCKVSQIWNNLTTQQKYVYEQKYLQIRAQNEQRIKQFIRNHQVPSIKRFTVMSRFLTQYAPIYQMKITDPQIYVKYRALPDTEKKLLSEQAKQMNRQSKQRMEQFLERWNISKQQLDYIMEVCDKYKKTKRASMKGVRKNIMKQHQRKIIVQDDDEDEYDDQTTDQEHEQ